MNSAIARSLGAIALCTAAGLALAQGFPTKSVKIVVPFPPGGNLDVTTRIVAESMAKTLGQPVVVENRGGAGGLLGSELVSRSAPDGYTLLTGTTATTIVAPMLLEKAPYELRSFAPVGVIAVTPLVLEVPAASPHEGLKGFLAHAKANPGKVSIGHSGNGTTNHIAILQLQDAAGVSFNPVPYKGSGPAIIDLIGGQIESAVDQTSGSIPHLRAGKLRALAVTTASRIADLPNVPTLTEQGLALEIVTPSVILAPAGTPPEALRALNAALVKAVGEPAIAKRLRDLGSEVRPLSLEQVEKFLKDEETRMKALAATGVLKGK